MPTSPSFSGGLDSAPNAYHSKSKGERHDELRYEVEGLLQF